MQDLLHQRKNGIGDLEWQDIADFLQVEMSTEYKRDFLRRGVFFYELFNDAGWCRPPGGETGCVSRTSEVVSHPTLNSQPKTTSINADGSESSEAKFTVESEEKMHDAEYLLELHGYDPRKFELISAKNSQWTTSSDGRPPLYSSKISVKPKPIEPNTEDVEAWFINLDRTYSKPEPKKIAGWGGGNKLLVIPISDLHFNLQATLFNSGNDYSCDIAEKIFFHIIRDVLDETARYDFQKIIFTIGGDQLNSDRLSGGTTKGTPQDNDKHYFDAYEQMCAMTVKAIDILAEKAPVDVVYIPGNHDSQSGFTLAKFIDAWFRSDDRVSVDYSPLPRKYRLFGKTLFCFTHNADVKRLQKLIPDEARELWARANFTEVMLQHLHSELVLEDCNMRIQRLPSPCARSVWTNDSGYRSMRQAKSFVYDECYGLKTVIHTVIPSSA